MYICLVLRIFSSQSKGPGASHDFGATTNQKLAIYVVFLFLCILNWSSIHHTWLTSNSINSNLINNVRFLRSIGLYLCNDITSFKWSFAWLLSCQFQHDTEFSNSRSYPQDVSLSFLVRQRNPQFWGDPQMLSIVLFLVSDESQECLDSESAWYHLGTFGHFVLFKMASKMAASSNKHPELHYYST
jgi:hypothetical protein